MTAPTQASLIMWKHIADVGQLWKNNASKREYKKWILDTLSQVFLLCCFTQAISTKNNGEKFITKVGIWKKMQYLGYKVKWNMRHADISCFFCPLIFSPPARDDRVIA